MSTHKKRLVGIFFKIDNENYVTLIDYRSKGKFQQLLEKFSLNAKICKELTPNDIFKFIPLESILYNAQQNLDIEGRPRLNKLILTIKALNDSTSHEA